MPSWTRAVRADASLAGLRCRGQSTGDGSIDVPHRQKTMKERIAPQFQRQLLDGAGALLHQACRSASNP